MNNEKWYQEQEFVELAIAAMIGIGIVVIILLLSFLSVFIGWPWWALIASIFVTVFGLFLCVLLGVLALLAVTGNDTTGFERMILKWRKKRGWTSENE